MAGLVGCFTDLMVHVQHFTVRCRNTQSYHKREGQTQKREGEKATTDDAQNQTKPTGRECLEQVYLQESNA